MKRWLLILMAGVFLVILIGVTGRQWLVRQAFAPTETEVTPGVARLPVSRETSGPDTEVVVENLEIPWALAWLPDGTLLVTERPGRLLAIGQDGSRRVINLPGEVTPVGEGGLLGVAVHPSFATNNWIYLYITQTAGEGLINSVERFKLFSGELTDRLVLFNNIPGAQFHDGGRLEFGPDEKLYITTGDAGDSDKAQDLGSLAGKILRVNDDGSVPVDNPFGTAVYSYGHRNPQGLAWNSLSNLWATEHGRSGAQSGFDEVNLIMAGGNFGWPVIEGDETEEGMIRPVINSGPDNTWAPAGAAFVNAPGRSGEGSLFFGGLRGESLYEAKTRGEKIVDLKQHFRQELGRIRTVELGPDGWLYLTTSNKDGRGNPKEGDDKIVKVNPRVFE